MFPDVSRPRRVRASVLMIVGAATILLTMGAGCISFGGGSGSRTADGALFRSANRGDTWEQRGALLTIGGSRSLAGINVRTIVQDPQDREAIYVGSERNGAFATWDDGTSWQGLGAPFAQARVDAVVVHPRETCSIFVAAGQKVFRTRDCGRHWMSSDFDIAIPALAIDPQRPTNLYAGTSRGDVLLSTDSGRSWRAIQRINNPIERMLVTSAPSLPLPIVYVASRSDGIRRSSDGGVTWVDLRDTVKDFPGALEFRDIAIVTNRPGVILSASAYGILRSFDGGLTWTAVPLITASGSVQITSLAVNPKNPDDIYYTTASTFYRTKDAGQTWESKRLPTGRPVTALFVDSTRESIIWMGTRVVQ